MWILGRVGSDTEEEYHPPCDTWDELSTRVDAVISLFGSKMFFMLQMKNVA